MSIEEIVFLFLIGLTFFIISLYNPSMYLLYKKILEEI